MLGDGGDFGSQWRGESDSRANEITRVMLRANEITHTRCSHRGVAVVHEEDGHLAPADSLGVMLPRRNPTYPPVWNSACERERGRVYVCVRERERVYLCVYVYGCMLNVG